MSMDNTAADSAATWAAYAAGNASWADWIEARLAERLGSEREINRGVLVEVINKVINTLTDDLERRIEKAVIELRLAARVQDGADGRSFRIRGTFTPGERYRTLDVVALNGGSFVAKQDDPGPIPGDAWQLLASQGKKGPPGSPGEPGRNGRDAAHIKSWQIDHTNYTVTPLMSDGTAGPPLYLRELFQHFLDETT
jgi:hypothetical protein